MQKIQQENWIVVIDTLIKPKSILREWRFISELLTKNNFIFYEYFINHIQSYEELIVEIIEEGYTNIMIVGNDTTINKLVNKLFNTKNTVSNGIITLAIIPVGRKNSFARSYNIDNNIVNAIDIISGWKTVMHDVGLIEYYCDSKPEKLYFTNLAGVGFYSYLLQRLQNKTKEVGKCRYLYNLFFMLNEYKQVLTKINIDSKEFNVNLFDMAVCIGKYNWMGIELADNAITYDGLFDVTFISDLTDGKIIKNISRLYTGSIIKHKNAISLRAKNITIDSTQPILVEIDGKALCQSTTIKFSIIPNSLQVITGK